MASSPSSSPSINIQEKHDVFLSFRGEDTRLNFISHLYAALCNKQIQTFFDEDGLKGGDFISSTLSIAIEESKISIIVFSKNYASSTWCLEELVKILECKERNNRMVIPVFYHVSPSDVRHQKGSIGDSFAEHDKRLDRIPKEKVQRWKAALTEASNLSGWDSATNKSESELVKQIVDYILEILMKNRSIPQEIWIPATKDYMSFESRISTLNDIRKALNDPNINMIGVYGMGGIGKTTLVREIAMKVEKEKLFDEVVFAHVSQTPEIRKIQGEIADKLDLEFHKETESGRARQLCERLSREKKILIILDNIWTSLKLEAIGIPFGDDHKGCKLLLTARSLDVLTSKMDCDNNFLVGILHEEDAWSLFKTLAGDCIENRVTQPIAKDVANECRGLPIAIVTIARALRNKGLHQWKGALHDLRNPSERSLSIGVQKEAYSSIELSYKYLEDDQLRLAFLLCSLMGDHSFILDLLKYSIAWGLLQGVETMEGARDKMDTLLDKLKASCLLLNDDGQMGESFSMHDVVRDVALSIASRDQHVFTVGDKVVPIKWPNKDALKNCSAISLRASGVRELSDGLECPKLKFLYIGDINFCLVKIPNNFFKGMTELQVLDLTGMQFSSLPSSIQLLGNLRTLCLDHCELEDISIVGELRRLEVLSFLGSDIEQLPKEIGQLNCLKLLDLSNCYKLKAIVPNIISNLSLLEELHMGNTFIQWDNEGPNFEGRKASLLELNHLSHLTNLQIHIKDAKILPKCTFFEKLERYQIHIRDEWDRSRKSEGKRMLKIKLNADICLEDILQLEKIEVLYLDEVHGVNKVLYEVHKEGFPELKHLYVKNSSSLLCIVDSMEWVSHVAFPMLESLSLRNLINLEKISNGQLAAKSFCNLNTIKVEKCDMLKNLFLLSTVESLPQLQAIEVIECMTIEGIFAFEKDDNNKVMDEIEFHHIRLLTLKLLPQLTSFSSKVKVPSIAQSRGLEENEVSLGEELGASTTLFNEMVVVPNLVELEVSAINCEKIWGNKVSSMFSCGQNLTRLIVCSCGNLKYIFPSSIVESFLHLQHLEICDCPLLREIIDMTEFREEQRKKIVFPQLNFLKIEDIENLTRFCSDSYVEFPSLKHLEIKQCPGFKAFILKNICTDLIAGEAVDKMRPVEIQPFFNDKVAFPNLEEMVISHLDDLKLIWDNKKFALHSFDKLKSIEVESCDELLTLFPSNTIERFSRLESLTIEDCGSLKEIFGLQRFEEITCTPTIQLKLVKVYACQSLKNIFPVSIAEHLLKLERLEIINCRDISNFVGKEQGAEASIVRFVFPKVTTLKLCGLPELDSFYPGVCTSLWPVLKDLSICCCKKLKVFDSEFPDVKKTNDEDQLDISTQRPLFLVEKIIPTLERLRLSRKEIMMICHDKFPRHFFNKLKILAIGENEEAVFPFGLLERFYNLEMLSVFTSSYKELFLYEEVEKYAGNLGRIKSLHIQQLYYLKCIWKQDYKLNSILQNLGSLHVQYCDNLVNLAPSSASFQNLTSLEVCDCNGMINLVTSSTAKSLKQLRDIYIRRCKRMTEIVKNEGDEAEDEIVFSKLEGLSLDDLESLRYFCSGNYTFKFPSLMKLLVVDCPKMEIFCKGVLSTSKLQCVRLKQKECTRFWEGDLNATIQKLHMNMVVLQDLKGLEVSPIDFEKIWLNQYPTISPHFQNLKRLIVQGIGQLEYLFSPSLVRSFLQLQHLEICNCSVLKEIITMEQLKEEERKDVKFSRLSFLKIEDLKNLTRFCLDNYVDFPSLKRLEIKKCPEFKAFVLKDISTDSTTSEVGKMSSVALQPFFNAKVAFPNLEEIIISHLDDLTMIWNNKLAHCSFAKLKLIKVEGCNELLFFFPSNMFGRFSSLECLIVNDCGSLEEIFGFHGSNFETSLPIPENKLKVVIASDCRSLKNIFQASIAKRLLQLEQLRISHCRGLTTIVAKEGVEETNIIRFVFPKLNSIVLLDLPKLATFYPGVHTLEWQVLKQLVVARCENVNTFASEMLDFQKTNDEGQFDIRAQPFFLIEKVIPGLQVLELDMKDIKIVFRGQFARDLFGKLNILFIHENEADAFPLGLLERFHNLNTLALCCSSYKELFSHEDMEKHTKNFAWVKSLWLRQLSNLKCMCKKDSKLNSILQNLEVLRVNRCDSLINLVPSSASFQNLTSLEVYYCSVMINLVTSSTARSLDRLREMSIEGCKRMIDIVADNRDISEDEIVFNKLEKLSLVDLESLTSFCSVNYSFNFPSLNILIVRNCPKMEIFCEGALCAPNLEMVCQNGEDWRLDEGCWEGDLNKTMQQLHHKMVVLRNTEALEVATIDFEKIWQNQCSTMYSHFQNLKSLIVQGLGNLEYLFPSSVVKSFLQLQHLEITKCRLLNEIIAMKELREEETNDILFPQLNFLRIEGLQNLTRVCSNNYVEFPSLKKLEIKQCPKLKAFVLENMTKDLRVSAEVVEMSFMELQPFFNNKVAFPDLEEILISHVDSLKMIWNNKLAHGSFDKLKLIEVEGCNELLTLFPSNMFGRFSRLESLTISKCGSIEEVFGLQRLNIDTAHSILVNKLKQVSVSRCQSLKNIFQVSIAKSLLKLEQLQIDSCGELAEIVAPERGAETSTIRFVLPKVTRLVLACLPKLTTFYPGVHTSEWPMLEVLTVADCEKVKTFASEILGYEKINDEGQLDIPSQQPLFLIDKIIPRLENLQLSMKDFMLICHGQDARHLFSKLNILVIRENEEAIFRLGLLDRFYNLKILTLGYSAYKELFSYEDMEKHAGNLARIKRLRLENLSVLQHMWKQDSRMNLNLQNLESLDIERCGSLINLVSSSASFQNLTTLKLCYCKGMISLVTSSTAKTLVQLREMSIEGCERMTEIVADESDVAEDEIVFNKLDELSLVDLKSLTSFCSANHALKFPSLEILIVKDCPAMKIFCEGALSTSKLEMVCQTKEDWRLDIGCWEGELNTTVQQLYSKMNVHRSEEDSGQPSVL